MSTIAHNLQAVKGRIARACALAGRNEDAVTLLAVSKTMPSDRIAEAFSAGQSMFGENHEQEAVRKIGELAHLPIEWHFIGPIQSNKTRPIAEHFAWVHSVDRAKIAERLASQRLARLAPLQVCVQVNVSGEASKSGVAPGEAPALARLVAGLPNLKLRGLMTIPAPSEDETRQRAQLRVLRDLATQLNAEGIAIDTLSMGMSDDLEAAVMEGSTMVRIGTAIFGARR